MVVGLTGGIGSGKTTVLNLFKELGVPVFIADVEAKKLMNGSTEIKKRIVALLGQEAYVDGILNRPYIASKVFKDRLLLSKLNAIVHPQVHKALNSFAETHTHHNYVLYESAILFENKNEHLCDKVIVVTAPLEVRIQRVVKRDQVKESEVLLRMEHQWSQEKKVEKADFIIENDDDAGLQKKVIAIHKKITS